MIIGERFAWGHMGKTGGDATATLFDVVKDLIVFAHDVTDRRKHQTFQQVGPPALERELKVLNIRRLPSWQLSLAHHRARHGTADDPTPKPLPSAAEMAESTEADKMLLSFTGDGAIQIGRWLRMECLREDFTQFVSTLRPLTEKEVDTLGRVCTKPAAGYDHDVMKWFSDDQRRRLYENNPAWASVEEEVYGSLLIS